MKHLSVFVIVLFSASANSADWPLTSGSLTTWPVSGKSLRDISLFFSHDDSAGINQTDCSGKKPYKHLGIDIVANAGTTVVAVDAGVVKKIGGYGVGFFVAVESGSGTKKWTTVYGHLGDQIMKAKDVIKAGDVIGHIYPTDEKDKNKKYPEGDVPHLHFGIRPGAFSDGTSQLGIDCSSLKGFDDPLSYLKHPVYITIDDTAAINTMVGTWTTSTSNGLPYPFYFGTGYKAQSSSSKGSFTFSSTIPEAGTYSIFARWTIEESTVTTSNRDTSVTYQTLQSGRALATTFLNQADSSKRGKWVEISSSGGIKLAKGPVLVTLKSNSYPQGKYVIADAVMFVKQ